MNPRQQKQQDDWVKANTDVLHIKARKELEFPARIEKAVSDGKAASKQAYIIEAVKARLESEGY